MSLIIEKKNLKEKTFFGARSAPEKFSGLFWGDFAGFEYIFHVPGPGFEC